MRETFQFLAAQPYVLLFVVVALAAAVGRVRVAGFTLGTTASAILVGAAISIGSAAMGVELKLDEFTKQFAYYLFMYAVGLRIGPSLINSFDREGLGFALIAVIASVTGLVTTMVVSRLFALPAGMDVGLLAGALTESAAIGAADGAVTSGAAPIPLGMTTDQLMANAAIGYSLTYVFGSIGIIFMVRLLPRLFGADAAAAAKQYESEHSMTEGQPQDSHGWGGAVRAVEITDESLDGQLLSTFFEGFPKCRAVGYFRNGTSISLEPKSRLVKGDVIALAGPYDQLLTCIPALGKEIADPGYVKSEIDHAEIFVYRSDVAGKTIREVGQSHGLGVHLTQLRRSGQPQPWGPETIVKRGDVIDVVGDRAAVERLSSVLGERAHISIGTDLMTLAIGIVLGLLMGMLTVNVGGIHFGLGSAASVLVSGAIIASLRERLPIFGNTPTAARQLLEDIGLTVFVAIIGVNAGSHMIDGVTVDLAIKVLVGGVFVSTLPPLIAWAVGFYFLRINAAVLMGVVAGARVNTAPVKEATNDLKSSVPWVGYPIPYAVSNVLDSFWGYFLMVIR